MRRFASLFIAFIVLAVVVPQPALAEVPNDPPAFDRSTPSGNTITTLDSTGVVGQFTSATVGADGLAIISYYDLTNKDLKVAHCSDAACTAATITTLDAAGNQGPWSSIALGADGLAVISYYDYSAYDLKVAHCTNVACTSATIARVDSTGDVGKHSSIAIGADGLPIISYFDGTNKDLKVAHCSDESCSAATTTTIDSEGVVGEYSSIALGDDGFASISYYGGYTDPNSSFSSTRFQYAHCADVVCSSASARGLFYSSARDGYAGQYTSIATGEDGQSIMSFIVYKATTRTQVLYTIHCQKTDCSVADIRPSTVIGSAGLTSTSITIGSNSMPLVAYYDRTGGDLKIGLCGTFDCAKSGETSLAPRAIDTTGDVGQYAALTIGADGNPLVAYHDATNGDLKVAHCSNPRCVPFFRRR